MRVAESLTTPLEVDGSPGRRALAWCAARRWALAVWSGMAVWSTATFAVVRSDYQGFRLGALRPREHDAGGMEHRARTARSR